MLASSQVVYSSPGERIAGHSGIEQVVVRQCLILLAVRAVLYD